MTRRIIAVPLFMILGVSAFAEYAGVPQREYRNRTYLIYGKKVEGPVYYAGDGRVVDLSAGAGWGRARRGELPSARRY